MENASESFFARFQGLDEEARNALEGSAKVDKPYEYRFDVEFPDRRYAVQGYPQERRVFIGQYLGDRGVVWFDELGWDDVGNGWRAGDRAAWDFFAGLRDRPSLSHPEAEELAAKRPQSGPKESPTSTEEDSRRAHAQPARAPQRNAGWFTTARTAFRTARRAQRTLRGVATPWGAAKTAVRILRRAARRGENNP